MPQANEAALIVEGQAALRAQAAGVAVQVVVAGAARVLGAAPGLDRDEEPEREQQSGVGAGESVNDQLFPIQPDGEMVDAGVRQHPDWLQRREDRDERRPTSPVPERDVPDCKGVGEKKDHG
ncbi:MAG: hypothetical protein EA376_10565 [Phycisphaeraceae bacterium]|nr:MAG: hypothetical protein EA376_10565 [Phycisphaeraceae bacterium]